MIGTLIMAAAAAAATPDNDMTQIDQTVSGIYEVISGPAGQKRDFDRLRSMFAPGATFMGAAGFKTGRHDTVEGYIQRSGPLLEKDGFHEQELGRRVEIYGNLASAWSAYDGRTDDGSFHERGINSIQLVKINGKWLIASLLWEEETPANPLPTDLAKKAAK